MRGRALRWLVIGGVCLGIAITLLSAGLGGRCARQDTVNEMRALTRNLIVPRHLKGGDSPPTADDFDPNTYFTVLDHLSMEPGYVLDYVYRLDGLGASPFIYARPADQAPYASYMEFLDAVEGAPQPIYEPSDYAADYLSHVVVDGAEEGFFQLATLYVLGDQFYLEWHAQYNEHTIVCDARGLRADLRRSWCEDRALLGLETGLSGMDLAPAVEMGEETVVVRFVTLSKWSGFAEVRYRFAREFPPGIGRGLGGPRASSAPVSHCRVGGGGVGAVSVWDLSMRARLGMRGRALRWLVTCRRPPTFSRLSTPAVTI